MKYLIVAILALIISYFVSVTIFAVALKLSGIIVVGILILVAVWIAKVKFRKRS